jgi:hypothetical protein
MVFYRTANENCQNIVPTCFSYTYFMIFIRSVYCVLEKVHCHCTMYINICDLQSELLRFQVLIIIAGSEPESVKF